MIRMLSILSFLFLTTVLSAADVSHFQRDAKYADQDVLVNFPAEAGPFRKTEVRRNFNPAIGTVVRYLSKDGSCADIYIYLYDCKGTVPGRKEISTHFQDLLGIILDLPKQHGPVSSVVLLKKENRNIHKARFQMTVCGEKRISELIVSGVKKMIVKFRLTGGVGVPDEKINRDFTDFMNKIRPFFPEDTVF